MAQVESMPFLGNITNPDKFRNYGDDARSAVKEVYYLNHTRQTVDFVLGKKAEYSRLDKAELGVWEVIEKLNDFVDDSDPDIELPQIVHALQTAEAIRQDGHPRWFVLVGLIHDIGKMLSIFGEPQWAVVGDTFPTGCAWSDRIVFPEFFAANPDAAKPELQTQCGVYTAGAGLGQLKMSWGHDEYLYHVTKDYLPEEAQYMIRYHSWYSAHRERDYEYLMTDHDKVMMESVQAFNPFDLYSKSDAKPQLSELRPYYNDLINEFFPEKLAW